MTAAAGVSSLYTVRRPASLVDRSFSLILEGQAFLGTAILMKWHKIETRKTIRLREMLMAAMAIFLLVCAIMYVPSARRAKTAGLTDLLGSVCSASVIIVPRSAGASSPRLPESVVIQLIKASGKSVRYRDSLAFDARTCFIKTPPQSPTHLADLF